MIILTIAFILLFVNIRGYVKKIFVDDTTMVLPLTVTAFLLYVFVSTEILSLFKILAAFPMFVVWIVFICVNLVYIFRREKSIIKFHYNDSIKQIVKNPWLYYFLWGTIMIVMAYLTPPYNQDSMAYHLPRVMHWVQSRSLSHFSCHYGLQVTAPVFGEYLTLHNFILSGYSDKFLCLMQCFAMLLNGVLIAQISRMLGCNRKWIITSVVVFISLPIVYGEALNTQVDLILSVIILSFVVFILYISQNRLTVLWDSSFKKIVICLGITAGLAFLTKYTAAFILLPFCIWLLVICIKAKVPRGKLFVYILLFCFFGGSIFFPEAVRLFRSFGTLFTDSVSSNQLVSTFDPRLIFVCLVKNVMSNLAGRYIYSSREILTSGIEGLASVLKVDATDPRISLRNYINFNSPFLYNHDASNGQLIVILLIFCLIVLLYRKILSAVKREKPNLGIDNGAYIGVSFLSFFAFLALLKYTENRARYEISFFAILSPAICYLLQNLLKNESQIAIRAIAITFAVVEILSLTVYHSRVIVTLGKRPDAYFGGTNMKEGYRVCCDYIADQGYQTVGIINRYIYQYPIWMMLDGKVSRIEDVNVTNATNLREDMSFIPDCIWCIDYAERPNDGEVKVHGVNYSIILEYTDGKGYYFVAERAE